MPPVVTTTPVVPAAPAAAKPVTPTDPKAPVVAPQRFKVKVDGKEVDVGLEDLTKAYSKVGFADKTVSQAKDQIKRAQAIEKQRQDEEEAWKRTPRELLKQRGVDAKALAREILEEEIRNGQMTPEQRELADSKQKLKEYEEREAESTKAKQEEGKVRLAKQLEQQLDSALSAACDKVGLSKNEDSFYAVYEVLKDFADHEMPFDAERIAELAKQRIEESSSKLEGAVLKGLKGEALLKRLGPAVVNEVLQSQYEKIRGRRYGSSAAPAAETQKPSTPSPYMSEAEFNQKLKERKAALG